ncbi:hypothetical protein JW998_07035 [candidate division KSB1 bacterium]|nr:hypothetical protein [candidate division KSB1 bacterium]
MKRLITTILCFLYLSGSSGIARSAHYCHIASAAGDNPSCCCDAASSPGASSCHTQTEQRKVDNCCAAVNSGFQVGADGIHVQHGTCCETIIYLRQVEPSTTAQSVTLQDHVLAHTWQRPTYAEQPLRIKASIAAISAPSSRMNLPLII